MYYKIEHQSVPSVLLPSPVFPLPAEPGSYVCLDAQCSPAGFFLSVSLFAIHVFGRRVGWPCRRLLHQASPRLRPIIQHQKIRCGVLRHLAKRQNTLLGQLRDGRSLPRVQTRSTLNWVTLLQPCAKSAPCRPGGGHLLSSQRADSRKQIEHFFSSDQIAAQGKTNCAL